MRKAVFLVSLFCFCFFSFAFKYKGKGFFVEVCTTVPVETNLSYGKTSKAWKVWVETISSAKKSVDFSEFYLTGLNKEPLASVINEIEKAAKRGVKIRFLVDRKMLKNSEKVLNYLEKIPNVKITVFDWKNLTGGINHSKYFIVDGKLCYVGSQNFDWRALKHIHETGILTNEKNVVKALSMIFNADWAYNNGDRKAYATLRKEKVFFGKEIALVGSPERFLPEGVEFSLTRLIKLINSAKKSVTIQLLNYSTYVHGKTLRFDTISQALKLAASRGVSVKLLVSNWNLRQPAVNSIKELAKVKNIEVKFVSIPVSKKEGFIPYARVIHSKVVVIDGKVAWVGTSNFGYDYFYTSRNVEVVMNIKPVAEVLSEMFNRLWNSEYSVFVNPLMRYKPPKVS